MSDLIERQAAIDLCDWYDNPSMHDDLEKLPSAQPEPEELDFVQPHKKIDVRLEIAQPEIIRCAQCKYADVVDRDKLIETIKHYAQYPDGIYKLLAVYAERRTETQ